MDQRRFERDMEKRRLGPRSQSSNENKMSDGGRGRASLGMKVWKSSQKRSAPRSAVRSIAWLDEFGGITSLYEPARRQNHRATRQHPGGSWDRESVGHRR